MPSPSPGRKFLLAYVVSLVLHLGCVISDRVPPPVLDAGPHTSQDSAVITTFATADCRDSAASDACQLDHASAVCEHGKCVITSCEARYADCDMAAANGCEASLDSAEHCGMCSAECRYQHATGRCESGQCQLGTCEPGYGDCDDNVYNGCETSLSTPSDCGACRVACDAVPQAISGCNGGHCGVLSCTVGYGDCNHKTEDGCEQRLDSPAHCGGCGEVCALPFATGAVCLAGSGTCVVSACAERRVDCNGEPSDGCEADLDTPEHCGACGASCSLPQGHVERYTCQHDKNTSVCLIDKRCAAGAKDCKPDDPGNGCSAGFADCDGKAENGCETDLSRPETCGACSRSCAVEHAITGCRSGACITIGCEAGYGHCSGMSECVSLGEDPQNCGGCGQRCSTDKPRCTGGRCSSLTCDRSTADCDGNAQNQCETSLSTLDNCGACGLSCTFPNATGSCSNGTCQLNSCEAGRADCDRVVANGCEASLSTMDNCGACGAACQRPNAVAECRGAQGCVLLSCAARRADCNGIPADGCEVDISTPEHCGGCGQACTGGAHVASARCTTGRCQRVCESGYADCNGDAADGCEVDLRSPAHCGACARECTMLPHVQAAACSNGSCQVLGCKDGFADCDADVTNGCERPLSTAADCGACNRPCALAHAASECKAGTCGLAACDSGFADCDGDASNGCESALTTPEHCGSCKTACSQGAPCNNGVCGCSTNADCSGGRACCDGTCTSTEGQCTTLPCLVGSSLDANRANCGGCGARCDLNCCMPLTN